jgi:hypothetical protein
MSASYLCFAAAGTAEGIVFNISDCTSGFVVEIATTVQPTLQDIFNIPVSADLLQAWELGFGLPVLCYMTAWAFGSLINFFDSKHDN